MFALVATAATTATTAAATMAAMLSISLAPHDEYFIELIYKELMLRLGGFSGQIYVIGRCPRGATSKREAVPDMPRSLFQDNMTRKLLVVLDRREMV